MIGGTISLNKISYASIETISFFVRDIPLPSINPSEIITSLIWKVFIGPNGVYFAEVLLYIIVMSSWFYQKIAEHGSVGELWEDELFYFFHCLQWIIRIKFDFDAINVQNLQLFGFFDNCFDLQRIDGLISCHTECTAKITDLFVVAKNVLLNSSWRYVRARRFICSL